ncbi:phosphoribosylformylglycinamidine cyclo-ligase [Patescibacteria group bacterium]|nr:phosphoribosylformylglycinamidine cyclo-ligase [Patescibacteria group bacterium]
MSTYEEAGVNIAKGDSASKSAYAAAKATFSSRQGVIGSPVVLEGGFTGLLDFGDFYVVQNNDGIGTKTEIARAIKKYDTIGYDLLAMVADDAVCVGSEVVSISNTFDVDKVNEEEIIPAMEGLKNACIEQKIVIPGGEIAELGSMSNGLIWNSTCVGVLEKDKFIDGSKIKAGDKVIGLKSQGFRSNGFSLVRHILKNNLGDNWYNEIFEAGKTWGEVTLTPALIYHNSILKITGRFKEQRKIDVHGIVHVTGGGIGNNLKRILKNKNLGANLTDMFAPHSAMLKLQEIGKVEDKEAYKTWNMGTGMLIIVDENDTEETISLLKESDIASQVIGDIIEGEKVTLASKGHFSSEKKIEF